MAGRWVRRCLVACLLLACGAAAARADRVRIAAPPVPERDISVTNHSSVAIAELYVSAASADDWGPDRINEQGLAPGAVVRIPLGRIRDCTFDVQAIYADASKEERHGVDLCRTRQTSFDRSALVPPPEPQPVRAVVVVNRTPRTIAQVYISDMDAMQWGDDQLLGIGIPAGGRSSVQYAGPCMADVRIVFDNRAAEERRGLDICHTPELQVAPGWDTVPDPP